MLQMNLEHADFQLEMELLSSLPRSAPGAPMALLAQDLGVDVTEIRELTRELTAEGRLSIIREGGNRLHLGARTMDEALGLARTYCAKMGY